MPIVVLDPCCADEVVSVSGYVSTLVIQTSVTHIANDRLLYLRNLCTLTQFTFILVHISEICLHIVLKATMCTGVSRDIVYDQPTDPTTDDGAVRNLPTSASATGGAAASGVAGGPPPLNKPFYKLENFTELDQSVMDYQCVSSPLHHTLLEIVSYADAE